LEKIEHIRRKWASAAKEQQHEVASRAGKAAWANLSPEERSEEMKRRAAKRSKRQ
jgi:hypothetical protein